MMTRDQRAEWDDIARQPPLDPVCYDPYPAFAVSEPLFRAATAEMKLLRNEDRWHRSANVLAYLFVALISLVAGLILGLMIDLSWLG